MEKSEVSKQLIPISIDLLYAGMIVPHDIYCSVKKYLLLSQGSILTGSQIERMRNINKGKSLIHVSVETARLIRFQGMSESISKKRQELEEGTGYLDAKNETVEMLAKVTSSGGTKVNEEELSKVTHELSNTVYDTKPAVIMDLVNALAPVDEYLQRHCVNVSLLNGLMGKWLGLPRDTVDMLVLVGLLHDCGKTSIPPKILSAARRLTTIEMEVIKTHPMFSYSILSEFADVVRCAARGHHEKINGKGYPDGLSGDKIPYMARVTAISDIYDAMTARRAYKEPKNPFGVLGMLQRLSGTELDAELVKIFVENMPKELLGKPVLLSNGTIGVVHELVEDDIEFPVVKSGNKVIKTSADDIYCVAMYFDDDELLLTSAIEEFNTSI